MRFYLAKDYFTHQQFTEALPIFFDLRENYADVFLEADQQAIHIGHGGYYAEILYCLSVIYRKLGDHSQAKALAQEMKALVPNDQRADDLQQVVAVPRLMSTPEPRQSATRLWLVAFSAMVLLLTVAVLWRRRKTL